MTTIPLLIGTEQRQLAWRDDHGFTLELELEPGLYTIGLQADLRTFDWESLYVPMTWFGNSGQRTGPWDFDLYDGNKPLIPTWKLTRNGEYLGLFYLQRPTAEDIAAKRLRGEFGVAVRESGKLLIEAEPYREFALDPIAMYVEPNAFDHPQPQPWAARGLAANWPHYIAHTLGWEALRERLTEDWASYLREGCRAYRQRYTPAADSDGTLHPVPAEALPVLILAYQLLDDDEALAHALQTIRHFLGQPAWGNPDPFGYGHNGDMLCGSIIKNLTLACNWLDDELGDLREPLLERLTRQMRLFFDQQLLMAQYWGGALLQDHGYRSSPCMAFAAIGMLGHVPQAEEWLAFYVPRFYRTLDKLPHDGFIPFANYHKIQLYVNDMTDFRVAYQFAAGVDLFAETPAFRNVPAYLLSCLDEPSMNTQTCTTRGDRKDFSVGLPFFFSLARDHECERSAYLANLLWSWYKGKDFRLIVGGGVAWKAYDTMPMAFLLHQEGLMADRRPEVPALHHFPDGGAIQYRNHEQRFNVAITCLSTTAAFHALGTDLSGTDVGLPNPSCGNVAVALGRDGLIQSAESGYRTGTHLGNVLLIDGRGQYGDCQYPMGVPLATWRGQRIQRCVDHGDGTGFARLNLAPAYDDDLEVLTYTRDFHFAPTSLVIRDTVITRQPHDFAYCFHTYERNRLEPLETGAWRFAHDAGALRFSVESEGWQLSAHDTEVVWAYSNENESQCFRHLRLASREPVRAFSLTLRLELETSP